MNRQHNFEERLNVVSRIIEGEPIEHICQELRLDHHHVKQWYLRYRKYGEDGLRGTKSHHYSAKEKYTIVSEYEGKRISLQEICLRYNLSLTAVKSWIRKKRNGESLEDHRRGPCTKDAMARPKKEPQTELEKLQAENLRLRAENALLKKVKALVEEEEARARLNGRKPSTN